MSNLSKAVYLAAALGSLALAQDPRRPVLRAGVSVEMAATQHAVVMPQADEEDAQVVAVTIKGKVYLGITPLSPAELPAKVRGGQPVYLKADARASYSVVAAVLDALRQAGFSTVSLLTSQLESPQPGHPAPPKGLTVRLAPAAGAAAVEVQIRAPGSATYGDVVRVIDACRGTGAGVLLATPGTLAK